MTVPILLISVAGLVVHPPAPSTPAVDLTPSVAGARFDAQRGRSTAATALPRRHQLGVGASATFSSGGGGGSLRAWFGDRVGVNFDVNYHRLRTQRSSSAFSVVPSVIVMLTGPHPNQDVDIRPYVGGGLNYVRSSLSVQTVGGTATAAVSGTGGQVFGGIEMTFRDTDWVTVSAEMIYFKLPVRYVDTSTIGGLNALLAFHFYLR